mmetsp:Transcript_98915/g.277019  ORF Transcript_98915/g.277019 Transcript_98915/m.277019 type:complete len:242 (+) Transcript_98915:166-891(+)
MACRPKCAQLCLQRLCSDHGGTGEARYVEHRAPQLQGGANIRAPNRGLLHQGLHDLGARWVRVHADESVLSIRDHLREPRGQQFQLHPKDGQGGVVNELDDFDGVVGGHILPHNLLDRFDLGGGVTDRYDMRCLPPGLLGAQTPQAFLHCVPLGDHVQVNPFLHAGKHPLVLCDILPGIEHRNVELREKGLDIQTGKEPLCGVLDPTLRRQCDDADFAHLPCGCQHRTNGLRMFAKRAVEL